MDPWLAELFPWIVTNPAGQKAYAKTWRHAMTEALEWSRQRGLLLPNDPGKPRVARVR